MHPIDLPGSRPASRVVSRRALLKLAAVLTSALALPPSMAPTMASALASARRRSVIWLSFQECTGCTESLTRAAEPTIESLIFDALSLDYHHTLQAVSGEAAEASRRQAMQDDKGRYLVVVDGSVPLGEGGVYSTIAGLTNLQMLQETVEHAAAVVAVGSCAAFGGIAGARPNPTGAVGIGGIVKNKILVNVPGCPPMPQAIAAVLAHLAAFGTPPALDAERRPLAFYGETVHDGCYRKPHFKDGRYAASFDDKGARQGWCLLKLGCRGQTTRNACSRLAWNAASSPVRSGHGCLGCSQKGFWDAGGFYTPQVRKGRGGK